jgi:hypothetical protein
MERHGLKEVHENNPGEVKNTPKPFSLKLPSRELISLGIGFIVWATYLYGEWDWNTYLTQVDNDPGAGPSFSELMELIFYLMIAVPACLIGFYLGIWNRVKKIPSSQSVFYLGFFGAFLTIWFLVFAGIKFGPKLFELCKILFSH